ncbi:UDP-glucoronosyl and UDP-glucosyl transferase domain-containing protein [Phthorimaea operculella]|nr:UDP-glucoronosyl and UDP-glucosyl transferase domain-containing protein [Phthorimaea operculella]
MSFGTNVDPANLPPETIQMFIRVFSKMPYDVLWKWNQDELPGKTKNIRIGKWFPESDLLRHRKVKLFLTQGGLQSTDEAIVAGVPLIGIPMLGDQCYRKNIKRMGATMRDEPMSGLQRAVWWTEHVLRHGGARHLRAPAANISWAQYLELELLSVVVIARQDKVIKDIYGLDAPSLNELNNNIGMLFLNTHRIFEGNTPVPPTVIHIWGINNKPEKCLPEDLKYYMDASKNGVIYMSFGTNVDPANFPPERIQMFIKVFSKLPYNILWKWNQDVLPGKTENIRISKWFPQADLLRHPNIKLFITQGGLQSTDEAIVAGVPLIGIPMLADQWYNVEKYIFHGIGKKLEMETISEEKMLKTITEVTKNNRYRKNIQKLGALMRDEPMSGLQRAVWWTEHVLRHGGARHLRAPAANISWAQYLELELVHQIVFRSLTQELARRGHEVVVVTTDPVFSEKNKQGNLTEINVHASYDIWRKKFLEIPTGKKRNLQDNLKVIYSIVGEIFDEQLKNAELKKIIDERQHFDLLILEAWIRPTLVLSHIFKAPVIQISSLGRLWYNYEDLGAPVHPLLNPISVRQRLYNLTLWEKINELYIEWQYNSVMKDVEKIYDVWIKSTFGSEVSSLNELSNNIAMFFSNKHPIWEGNNPVPSSIINVWGINQKPEEQLPKELQTYLDDSRDGVIYFSFGTNVDTAKLSKETIQVFVNVFSKLPFDVLWKWNQDVLPGISDNIKINKWFPQSDLLRHPKIKLFITQGGQQSTDEAIVAGVPLIGIPMLSVQWYNAEKYIHHGIGKRLFIESLTEEELRATIEEVIGNKRYRENIKKLGALMRDEPMSGLQRAVWWTEHVLRHGGARHLRAPAANISWKEYLELELQSFIM